MPFGSTPGVVIKDDGTPVLSPAAAINCGSGLSASDDGAGQVTLTASGGTAEPGGTNGQIQYNNAGALGGLDSTGTGNPVRENSPTLTGTPAAPTAAPGTDTAQIATTAFVKAAVLASNYIDGEVETHADLPVTVGTPAVDSAYLVRESTGIWLINRKPAGIWVRLTNDGDLDDWSYAGTFPDVFSDANFSIYDNADTSKELGFSLGGITTGQKRILTPLDKNYTVEETGHAAKHTDGTDDIQSATASQKGLATAAQITKLDGIEAAADVTDAGNVGAAIHGATGKTTPVDADTLGLIDSEASNVLKKLTWANLKTTLGSTFQAVISFGTGVLTALGVNVGSAGSVVVNGGALGTPSSGTLTNCTGLSVAGGGTGGTTVLTAQQSLNPLTINEQGASYTLVLTDAAKQVNMNVAGANTLTIPKNSSVAFPVGTQILCRQIGAGLTTASPVDGDVTLLSRGSAFKSAGQGARWVLSKEATDTWYMDGDITT